MRTRGWLDTLVLAVVAHEPAHGYSIASSIDAAGVGSLADASIYPVLKKLEGETHLVSEWDMSGSGPARKVYSITESGHRELHAGTQEWQQVRDGVDSILLAAPSTAVQSERSNR